MVTGLDRNDVPDHLLNIPELDFSDDLFSDPMSGSWFRLGAWTIETRPDSRGVEDVIGRQSLLLPTNNFPVIYDRLESIGNVIDNLGKSFGSTEQNGDHKQYSYSPFHEFCFPFTKVTGEPLVCVHFKSESIEFFVNPDFLIFFELEKRAPSSGIWWDPTKSVEVLRRQQIEEGSIEIVEVRTDYLMKYLQARQLSLLIGHYRHLHLFAPSPDTVNKFVQEDVTLGSSEERVKAILQNGVLQKDVPEESLLRRLHLWIQIPPPAINIDDPWSEEPPFDAHAFTLPTTVGPVAPARWKPFRLRDRCKFEGENGNFMQSIYFRQDVLAKYEGTVGFTIGDDGTVSYRHYWALYRGTSRIGNELLSINIGDFAEGIPFEEWPHWRQYAVEPPSLESMKRIAEEQPLPVAVKATAELLDELNAAFAKIAALFGLAKPPSLWNGSLDSLAGRQLKWVYPTAASDDEFLKRSTLLSTFVLDALAPKALRSFLQHIDENLHLNDETPRQSLGSRKLLQRMTLIAALIEEVRPEITTIPSLVMQAEGKRKADEVDLQIELCTINKRVKTEFAPLAFLYDLRTSGGLAHQPNKPKAAKAAKELGLPGKNWQRNDYLHLLDLVSDSLRRVISHLDNASQTIDLNGIRK